MKRILSIILLLTVVLTVNAQTPCLLEQDAKQDLVQDYAGILTESEEQTLRQQLIAFNDTVSNQILIVTVTDLCGYDKAEFSYTLGEKWKVGQDGKDNGIVIMVKPKEIDGRGDAFIATGRGLEGVLPDAIAKRIVENEMIPSFKQKDYYGGIYDAALTVMQITGGEYTAEEYSKVSFKSFLPFIFGLIIFIIIIAAQVGKTKRYASTNGLGFWAAWSLMSAASRGSGGGSFGNFSSGGGGFSGFGGGSFGGGGAGGSW